MQKLLHPPVWVQVIVPVLSFSALVVVFVRRSAENTLTYFIYSMSAYSLVLWVMAVPRLTKRLKSAIIGSGLMQKALASSFVKQYLSDPAFRGSISIYQGMAVNFFYVVFCVIAGVRYASVWFVSMAVYYLVLGGLRAYLIIGYRRRNPHREVLCYRTTAWLLFLLNIPMGGMIVLMVRTNSGYTYPGYIIYLSALYTFYAMVTSVIRLVKFRKLGSPILSAAKVLHFVAAMMSILGLQTAMISRFSINGAAYRKMMNAITGGVVYGIVILIAVYMLFHSRNLRKKVESVESFRE